MDSKRSSIVLLEDIGLILLVVLTRILSASGFLHKWDSVQFALALSDYDITRHQPHPQGYPGYIAMGRLARQLIPDDNAALIAVGVIFAAVTAVAVHRLGIRLLGERGGFVAGLLASVNPLLWYFSSVALSYTAGAAVATLAAWAAFSARGRARWLIPVIAGFASLVWLPGGVLVLPVCAWGFLRRDDEVDESAPEPGSIAISIAGFLGLFLLTLFAGYLPAVMDTGGFGPYLNEITSESGKHVLRFGSWARGPIDEFLATTGSLGGLFEEGLRKGKWLLLALLVPIAGEKGCPTRRVIGILPLGIAGFIAMCWGPVPFLRVVGILVFFLTATYVLPRPLEPSGWNRLTFLALWLIPGLLLFVLVYVNYVGVLTIFLPPLILLEAWSIERAAAFMMLQTIREPSDNPNAESEGEEKGAGVTTGKGPDPRVGRFVAWVLVGLMVMNDIGGFIDSRTNESLSAIRENDRYFRAAISAVKSAPVPQSELIILGYSNYRHWTYYFPEAEIIWSKYLLFNPIGRNTRVWVSRGRHQEKVLPDEIREVQIEGVDKPVFEASFFTRGAKGLIVFPAEMDHFSGTAQVMPLFAGEEGESEPVCYIISLENVERIVFRGADWCESVDESGETVGGWCGDWEGRWWLE